MGKKQTNKQENGPRECIYQRGRLLNILDGRIEERSSSEEEGPVSHVDVGLRMEQRVREVMPDSLPESWSDHGEWWGNVIFRWVLCSRRIKWIDAYIWDCFINQLQSHGTQYPYNSDAGCCFLTCHTDMRISRKIDRKEKDKDVRLKNATKESSTFSLVLISQNKTKSLMLTFADLGGIEIAYQ